MALLLQFSILQNMARVVFKIILLFSLSLIMYTTAAMEGVDITFHADESGQDTIETILQKKFSTPPSADLNFGFTRAAIWLRLDIPHLQNQPLLLRSCYLHIDELDVYLPTAQGWRAIKTGDHRPFSARDVRHPCYVFDLSMASANSIYVRAKTNTLNRLPLQLDQKANFWQQQAWVQFGYGFYFAVLAAMFVYNFFVFLVTRDLAYIYYVGYLGSMALFLASMSGHSNMFLWPNATLWADKAPITLISISIVVGSLYILLITHAARYAPQIAKLTMLALPLAVVLLIVNFVGGILPYLVLACLALYMLVMATIAIVKSALQGYRPGQVMLLGIGLMFPGALIYYLRTVGIIPESWLTNNVLYLTSSLEAMVLSIALAYRIEALNQELAAEQQNSAAIRQTFSRKLLQSAENERRGIARELHDSFGQELLAVKNMISRAHTDDGKRQITQQLRNLIDDTRNMARSMYPQQIENLGFATALQTMLTETIVPAGIKLSCELEDLTGLLPKDGELQLYRIAQECATNIVRHSAATSAQVHLLVKDNNIVMKISDDGVGISDHAATGMGLVNIRERAAIIGARLAIRTRIPRGTEMIFQLAK